MKRFEILRPIKLQNDNIILADFVSKFNAKYYNQKSSHSLWRYVFLYWRFGEFVKFNQKFLDRLIFETNKINIRNLRDCQHLRVN